MLNYRTMSIRIKKGHKLYPYLEDISKKTTNLYNVTNFYVRQVFSGIVKDPILRQDNETYVIDTVNRCIKEHHKFQEITPENHYINYYLLDHVFKTIRNLDYYALPAHTNQHIMQEVFEAWKAFYQSSKNFARNPEPYKGRPKPPGYATKGGRKTCTFSNQICIIKDGKYLKFPKTKLTLNVGKIGTVGALKEVKVVPSMAFFTVQIVMEMQKQATQELDQGSVIGIDLGVNNFATITNNKGLTPFIINGKMIKSINQYYNKQRAHNYGILRQGMTPKEGQFYSKKLNRLDIKRADKIKDFMHKASKRVIDYCITNDIGTIIIGKNEGFKRDVNLRKKDKQTFIGIPYAQFIKYLTYKAEAQEIVLVITEESYTSKASFVDRDSIPVYNQTSTTRNTFSGKRVNRGLYRTKQGAYINADCNGSGNIIRKVVPNAFIGRGDRGVVDTPSVLSIA